MTYQELLDQLKTLNEGQLASDIAICDAYSDEYYQAGVEFVFTTEKDQVLDPNHPVIRY